MQAVRGRGSASVGRCFVDRFPIYFRHTSEDSPNRFTVTYIDSGFDRMSAFTTHLRRYKPLFEALRDFDLVYVGTDRSQFGEAESSFSQECFPEMSGDPCRRTISTVSSFIFTTETYLSAANPEFFPVDAWTFYATPEMSLAVRFTKDSSGVGNRKGNSPFDPTCRSK